MPYKDTFHAYGKLVLKTVATRALFFVGDLDEGMKILRREVGRRLRALPRPERNAVAATLNASGRRVEKWITMANEADGQEENRDESFRENSRAGRIFLTALSYIKDGGETYRSLAEIAVHVEKTLGERVTVKELSTQLEGYVKLSFIEKHPEQPELYRAKAPHVYWQNDSNDIKFNEKLVETALSTAYFAGHRVLEGAPGALARVTGFSIPRSRLEQFTETQIDTMRHAKARMEAREEELQKEDPSGSRVWVRDLYMAAYGDRDDLIEQLERYSTEERRSASEKS